MKRNEKMKKRIPSKTSARKSSVGQDIITSLKEAIAWASGVDIPVRVTRVPIPKVTRRPTAVSPGR